MTPLLVLWLVGAAAGVLLALYEQRQSWLDYQAQRREQDNELRVIGLAAVFRIAAAGAAVSINLAIGVLAVLSDGHGQLRQILGPALVVSSWLLLAVIAGEVAARLARRRLQRPDGTPRRRRTDLPPEQ